jgi:hypothetical protein
MTNDTNLSRRKLLASSMPAIAAAAAMAPAAAAAVCRLPTDDSGDDPVLAAIEAHRKAFEVYNSAEEICTRLYAEWDEQHDARGIYLGEYPEIKHKFTGELTNGIPEVQQVHTGRMAPRYATLPKEIDDNVPADCADPQAWKAQKHHEYAEWSGCDEGSPKSVAYDAWNVAHRRYVLATAALNIRPNTLAGAAALLRYIAESYDGNDDEGAWNAILFAEDDEDSEREPVVDNENLLQEILETIAEAVQSIQA